jgi:hypothetical protein
MGHDYPIEHFELMANVARHLKSIEVQLLRSEYYYESFGSWWFTFQKEGKDYRIVYDGRELELRFECDPTPEKVHGVYMTNWTEVTVRSVADLKTAALRSSIEDLIQEGLANVCPT